MTKTTMSVGVAVSQKGKIYIQQKVRALNKSARGSPIIALADLDKPSLCPAELVGQWLEGDRREQNFLLRFAVLEVEAWLLADKRNIAAFLSVSETRVPDSVEAVPDPKAAIVALARFSRSRHIRDALLPDPKSGAQVGANYNAEMSRFASSVWDINAAAAQSQSLARAIVRIEELSARHEG